MKFQVTTTFNNITVLIADYTVSKKKLSFNKLNVQYCGTNVSKIIKYCYKAPAMLATGVSYSFKIAGTTYDVKYIK